MDVRINIEKRFDKDIKKVSSVEQAAVAKRINQIIDLLREGQNTSNYMHRMNKAFNGSSLGSSLYVLKVNKDLRIILASEEDPLFDEHVLTLLRLAKHDDLEKTMRGVLESINQSFLFKGGDIDG